jgi:predicted esterase
MRRAIWMPLFVCAFIIGSPTGMATAQEQVEGVRVKQYTLEPTALKYYMIAADGKLPTPQRGFKLLIAMPGGSGSDDFLPFVQNIYKNALDKEFLLVQLVAPKWRQEQKIIWPTAANKVPGQKVSVEDFIKAAVADVKKRTRVEQRHVYTLSWSSSGPAAYAISLNKDTPVTGSFVAMSVFHPSELPALKQRAKTQRYYIFHSKEDRVCPYRMAELARDTLRAAGAKVEFAEYEGGHGWHGDVFGNIRKGIEWLQAQAPKS